MTTKTPFDFENARVVSPEEIVKREVDKAFSWGPDLGEAESVNVKTPAQELRELRDMMRTGSAIEMGKWMRHLADLADRIERALASNQSALIVMAELRPLLPEVVRVLREGCHGHDDRA